MLYYFNPLFDLTLAGMSSPKADIMGQEMSTLFLFMTDKSDILITDILFHPSYEKYLYSIGITMPKIIKSDSLEKIDTQDALVWGWTKESVKIIESFNGIFKIPRLSTIKKINSRQYCAIVNNIENNGVPHSLYCKTEELLKTNLSTIEKYPIVIKPTHGSSGFGFTFIEDQSKKNSLLKKIPRNLKQGGTIEPWLERTIDIGSYGVITQEGKLIDVQHYESIVSPFGGFIGNIFTQSKTIFQNYYEELHLALKQTAKRLYTEGYFGPFGCDSFIYRDINNNLKLAPVIEINGRQTMGKILQELHSKFATPSSYTLLTAIPLVYFSLDDYLSFHSNHKNIMYNSAKKEGVILLSPQKFSYDNGETFQTPRKYYFLIIGQTRDNVLKQRDALLNRTKK